MGSRRIDRDAHELRVERRDRGGDRRAHEVVVVRERSRTRRFRSRVLEGESRDADLRDEHDRDDEREQQRKDHREFDDRLAAVALHRPRRRR